RIRSALESWLKPGGSGIVGSFIALLMNKLPEKRRKPSSYEARLVQSRIGDCLATVPAWDSPSRELETSLPVPVRVTSARVLWLTPGISRGQRDSTKLTAFKCMPGNRKP